MEIIFRRSQVTTKKPNHLKKTVFIVYSPGALKIESATCTKIDTEITVSLPRNAKGFITSILREDEINEFSNNQPRLWVEILHKSFEETLEIKKNKPLGFVVIEPEYLKFKYETKKSKLVTKNDRIQTQDAKGNLEVFLIVPTLQKLLLE